MTTTTKTLTNREHLWLWVNDQADKTNAADLRALESLGALLSQVEVCEWCEDEPETEDDLTSEQNDPTYRYDDCPADGITKCGCFIFDGVTVMVTAGCVKHDEDAHLHSRD